MIEFTIENGVIAEIAVVASSGSKVLEQAAMRTLGYTKFEPGILDGKPVESADSIKFNYVIFGGNRASPAFVRAYRSLLKAVTAKDKVAADAAMTQLKVENLYDDAFFGIASYEYAMAWGDPAQQLAGLTRALADEHTARYLPKHVFNGVLRLTLQLQIDLHEYAEVLDTWQLLQKERADASLRSAMQPAIVELKKLRTDDRSYEVSGQIVDSNWHLKLFKRHFWVKVSTGAISEISLRCATGYVHFLFDPKLQYNMNEKYGACGIEIDGMSGTRFTLVQS